LTGISVSEDNPGYCSIDGVLFNKDQSILIRYPASKAGGYVIPNTVKTLGREAFYVSDGLTSVVFGDSVKIMELYVFKGCANLNSVKLNSTLKSIGSGAFDRCISLKTIDIPSSVTSISDAFGYSGLTAVNIPNSVQMIGQQCFRNCEDLRSVTIGDSVKQIGTLTFYYCRKLASLTLGSSIDSIGEGAFRGCSALEEIHIRAVNPPGTKEECFGEGAHNAVPTGIPVYVPCGSVEAYQNAETWSNFTNYAETPPVLVSLSTNNDRLGTASITKAGSCSDNTAVIEAVSAGENTRFMHWNDGNTDNPRTLALTQDTALTAIFEVMVASGTVGTWQWSVAGQPNDYTLTISGAGNMNSYAGGASLPWWNYRLGITSLVVEEGIQNVGSNALNSFAYLTSVSLANTVTAIGSKAFSECTALPSIDIPASVTGIAADAFDFAADCDLAGPWAWSCSHDCVFSAINVDSGNETYASHDGVLLNKDRSEVILCPKGKAGSYAIPATVTAIRDNAFAACNRLTEVSLPHSAVTIGNYAFYRCTGLRSLNISASTVAIGDYAFESCRQWTEAVEIPNSTKTIGKWAFRGCSNITSLSLGDSIVDIGEYAFQNCISLSGSVTIPNTLKVISDHIFYNCLKLSAVTLGDSVTSIGDNAFGLTAIESIVIPNSVTYIGVNAFAGCTSLRSAVLPESLTSIINQPFYNCNNLASITIPASVTSIGNYAFAYNSGLTEIIVKAVNPPALGERAFFNVSTIIPVTVPCGSTEAYQNADGWSDFSNYAEQAFARITVHSDDESMGAAVVTQDNTCENGNTAVIEAIPAPGFKFARWNDRDAQYKKNPRTIAVTADMELTARFEVDETYTVGGTTATSGTELPSFTVYPNPFTDYIIIDAAVNEEAVIYDLSGKAVLTASVKPGSNRIDTSALPRGVYLLKQGAKTIKIVK
jgi:hypothetical protein